MKWRVVSYIAFAVLFGLASALSNAADTRLQSATPPDYTNRWAIVIGINYTGRNDAHAAGVTPLKNAEADADAVAKALTEHYGYQAGGPRPTLIQLKGPQATKREIEKLFGKAFLKDRDRVTAKDSVLIFFAGHGDREKREKLSQTLIYPYDVQTVDGKGIDDTSCISIAFLLEQLKFCDARHKLLILDSCHSGELFKFQTRAGMRFEFDQDLFNAPVTQALTAAAGNQLAQDGDAHSPFTQALLEGLNGTTIRSRVFGASALISTVPTRVQQLNKQRSVTNSQTPRGGLLDGDGEFYFFRRTDLPAAEGVVSNSANVAVQTLPGLAGRWWFEETPWLSPAVRLDPALASALAKSVTVLKPAPGTTPVQPSFLESSDVAAVRRALREHAEKYVQSRPRQERMALGSLFQLTGEDLSDDQVARLSSLFDEYQDPHLKAALHHRLSKSDAGELYRIAIDEYEKATNLTRGGQAPTTGLLKLCWSDYGRFLLDTGDTLRARAALRNALASPAGERPLPLFVIDNLLLRSRAEGLSGEWQTAENSLNEALKLATTALPAEHPFLAVVHDQFAWSMMDRWELLRARSHFEAARKIRLQEPSPELQTSIGILHNEHGLSMIDRFSGNLPEARAGYERLAERAKSLLPQAQSHYEQELVYGRVVNSLERLADCYLFATPPDPVSAYDTIARALPLCRSLAPVSETRTRVRLECKASMALALVGKAPKALETVSRLRAADFKQLIGGQAQELEVFCSVAESLARLQTDTAAGRPALRAAIDAATRSTPTLAAQRQQWELALFSSDVLVRSHADASTVEAKSDATRLLDLAAGPLLGSANLRYLRPYIDTALQVRCGASEPLQLPSLADQLLRAKSGDPNRELPRGRPAVVFYLRDRDGYALVWPGRNAVAQQPVILPLPFGKATIDKAVAPETLLKACNPLAPPIDTYWADAGVVPPLTNQQFPFADAKRWKLMETMAEAAGKTRPEKP